MNLHAFSVLCFSYGVFLIAILSIVKNRDRSTIKFFIFCLFVGCWGALFALWITQNYSYKTTLQIIRFSYVFVMFIPITWLHFLFAFLNKKEPVKLFYATNYLVASVLAVFCLTPLMFPELHSLGRFQYLPTPGPLHHVHMVFYAIYIPFGFFYLIKDLIRANGNRKIQLIILCLGTLAGFIPGTANYLGFYNVNVPFELHLFMPIYPILMGLAIIRFGLFDPQELAETFRRDKLAAIGILASSINHEIRNPLYVIQGVGQTHLHNVQEKTYKTSQEHAQKGDEAIQKSLAQAERAMDIMKRFSTFAKQGVDQSTQPQAVSVNETIENIMPLLRYELEADGIAFRNGIDAAFPDIWVDPRHLEEIIFNLMINACQAIKGSGRAHGEIKISGKVIENKVQITVADDGPGIPQDQLSKVFMPFHTTKATGTGLGLYIVKQLVEKNNGIIKVITSDHGVEFIIELSTNAG